MNDQNDPLYPVDEYTEARHEDIMDVAELMDADIMNLNNLIGAAYEHGREFPAGGDFHVAAIWMARGAAAALFLEVVPGLVELIERAHERGGRS